MKKFLITIMAIITIITLASCGKKEEPKVYVEWEFGSSRAQVVTVINDEITIKKLKSYIMKRRL